MLNQEDHDLLQEFLKNNNSGSPYSRRIQILLLADSGNSSESIAAELGLPIVHVRQWLRAYNRQGLQVFPDGLLYSEPPFFSEDPITISGKKILGSLLSRLLALESELETSVGVKSVHESRKTIRRMRTAMKQLAPYYGYIDLKRYRRRFRKVMRRLAPSRDIAVFLYKLQLHMDNGSSAGNLPEPDRPNLMDLHQYWQEQATKANLKVQEYLLTKKYSKLLVDFGEILEPDEQDFPSQDQEITPYQTGHLVPVLVYERLANVRAYNIHIEGAPLPLLHALRIQLKEFRYTLEFYTPVLGPTGPTTIETIKHLLSHLGDLNDASIHLEMLAEMEVAELAIPIATYTESKRIELQKLVAEFPDLWAEINGPAWGENLARAVAAI
jgi:CHAD domain-containing protein